MVDVAVSAPAKVLIGGGYLVLDRAYTGLVFGLSARIHVRVRGQHGTLGASDADVVVRSPQFTGAEWRYRLHRNDDDQGVEVEQLGEPQNASFFRNSFVETALVYTLSYLSIDVKHSLDPIMIAILADSDYYSQPRTSSMAGHAGFQDFGVPLPEAHKTGLGSSAALVTALTAALLHHYAPNSTKLSEDHGKSTLHNLAQIVHSVAQGKVGSGFDVAAAVYGSCRYRRFSPSILDELDKPGSPGFALRLKSLVDGRDVSHQWDAEIDRGGVKLPRGLRLVMCDVDCGSQTVGMAKKVLSWRSQHPQAAKPLWDELQHRNDELRLLLTDLANQKLKEPETHMRRLKQALQHLDRDGLDLSGALFYEVRNKLSTIRSLIRRMSREADVPIEPPSQTALLDACSELPGVVGGVVPGAGGYDAIALLMIDDDEVLERLKTFCETWQTSSSDADAAARPRVRVLGVREETEGARVEDASRYHGWLA
ncbi:MAG: hypothetical protein M1823_001938 [Watsoniomyces obsoletus]|nr:MAG: hypothetical protein M1823_001938 [Watsoniomyces obsoletus]